ncbi:MAG: hypothetical protein ACRDZ3_00950 [Acidimicrobiia bacterium]
MSQTKRNGRAADPVSALAEGMRRVANIDLREITRGLSQFANPGGGFLDLLGQTREERVEKMAGMLRNSSEADMKEMGTTFALAMAKVAEEKAAGGGRDRDEGRPRTDPLSRLSEGMRRLAELDLDDITRGLASLTNPGGANMLDMLGKNREERVEKLAGLLRNGSEADMEEMGTIYALAMARVSDRQADSADEDRPRRRTERPRRPRGMTSAEWRAERRRAS